MLASRQDRSKAFDDLDELSQLVTHFPNKGEQMARYYGFYSNKSRGLCKKADTDDAVPGKTVSPAVGVTRIFPNAQFHLKKLKLTKTTASVIKLGIGSVELMPQYLGPQPKPIHN